MKKWVKGVLWGVGIVATGGTIYAIRLNKSSKKLEIIPRVNLHKLALTGITLRVDTQIKNPTGVQINLKYPFVKLLFKDATVGTSQVVNKDVTFPKNGEVTLDPFFIEIPISGAFSLAFEIYKALLAGTAIKVKVYYSTIVKALNAIPIPFESSYEVTIKK